MAYRKYYKYQLLLTLVLDAYFKKSTVWMLPAKRSTLTAKSKEHFSAYNLLDTVDHFLLLRTLHMDSKDHLLLVFLLFFWLLFLSCHGLFFSIPRHPNVTSLFFSGLLSPRWPHPPHPGLQNSTFCTSIICTASPWFLPFPHITCIFIYLVVLFYWAHLA